MEMLFTPFAQDDSTSNSSNNSTPHSSPKTPKKERDKHKEKEREKESGAGRGSDSEFTSLAYDRASVSANTAALHHRPSSSPPRKSHTKHSNASPRGDALTERSEKRSSTIVSPHPKKSLGSGVAMPRLTNTPPPSPPNYGSDWVMLQTLRAGEYFGEVAFLPNTQRTATCIASQASGNFFFFPSLYMNCSETCILNCFFYGLSYDIFFFFFLTNEVFTVCSMREYFGEVAFLPNTQRMAT